MKPSTRIVVLGAGGHAKAVVGAAQVAGLEVLTVYDDDPAKWGKTLLGVRIVGPLDRVLDNPRELALIAIADPLIRESIVARMDLDWYTLIHPRAFVHPSASVGEGTVCFAGVVVQPEVSIGEHAIINANATVAHDCVIGDLVHLAPGVDLAGSVRIGRGAFIGTGAVAIPGISIGAWTTIGAGAAVVRNIPERVLAVGTPAKIVKSLA